MPITEIPKVYDPKSVESYWADVWIKERIFQPQLNQKTPFVIVIPPPNVTGSLHMGHALNNTLQDILIRWKKMNQFECLWVPGTDHGGIATQNVVEKMLKAEKKSRYDLGREKFLERMWQWRKESGDTILMQLRKLGCSLDWTRTRFTMDETCSKSVLFAFNEFFKKGWIYRGKRMVNWCVRCQTALSDIEVEYEERKDKLYYIRYPILSGKKEGWQGVPLVVATTRPETMLGDTAVAVHPDDTRYEKIHGWWIQLPLVEKEIPLITDHAIDPKFGTGVVKVTPAHDPIDFEIGQRHHLAQEVVIGFDGKMSGSAGKYATLSREECRKEVVKELETKGLIEKIEDYRHSVGVCYRCGVIVEPLISDQWFLKVDKLAEQALKASKEEKIKIFPETWNKPYVSWLENLKDWCISRQIWWGHRIPVWYCNKCDESRLLIITTSDGVKNILTDNIAGRTIGEGVSPLINETNPENPPSHCPKCKGTNFTQDTDVLDTWFSSALWPISVLGWPEESPDLKRYYPTSVLVTGHEILYLWVARMAMMGLYFKKEVPFSHVFIHGIVRDKQGKKMSKSLGNVIDPLTIMQKYGTDALRFVLTYNSVPGRDMQLSEDSFISARNFCNKIWNVSRFVLMNIETTNFKFSEEELPHLELDLASKWILSRFQKTVLAVEKSLLAYDLAQTSRILYQFIWSEFCDWYVELSKLILLDPTKNKETTLKILLVLIKGIVKLLHPMMPFITEEIWKKLGEMNLILKDETKSVVFSLYPKANIQLENDLAETNMDFLMTAITKIRTIRSEMNVPPATKIEILINGPDSDEKKLLEKHSIYIQHLCKVEKILIGNKLEKPQKSATLVFSGLEIFMPLEGLIDFSKEQQRLLKEFNLLKKEIEHLDARLSQPDFKTHAPEEEIVRTLERKKETDQKLIKLKEHLELVQ
ncbi:MAG: valine--tRNA ligase [Elusimicrobia bacterium GWA2_38_7]|nr:MAG: valine--tRNA ligase [Elusimicrobia bacterium GWA2_38_7]